MLKTTLLTTSASAHVLFSQPVSQDHLPSIITKLREQQGNSAMFLQNLDSPLSIDHAVNNLEIDAKNL